MGGSSLGIRKIILTVPTIYDPLFAFIFLLVLVYEVDIKKDT